MISSFQSPQVYGGMAGFFLVSDDEEQAAGLPGGEYDIPLVIQDRAFDNSNQLDYLSGNRMQQMTGFLGDWILVKFGDYPGLFLYHCHNLEHEDMGMMRNYLVESGNTT